MTLKSDPPPIQIPPEWAMDKLTNRFFTGLINTIYQLWVSVYGWRSAFKVSTTDATATAAIRVPVAPGRTTMVVAYCVARRQGGSSGADGDSAWYRLIGAYKNIGGVMTGIGTPSLFGGEDQPAWDFFFTSSGEEIVVTVQGAASNDITWEGAASTYTVGA